MKVTRRIKPQLPFTLIFLFIVLCNLLFLDVYVLRTFTTHSVLGTSTDTQPASCPRSCIDQFSQYVSSQSQAVREYFIPLGSGTSTSTEWTDVSGAQSYIDTTQYRKIKKAVFEATIYVPTGNQTVTVRLFNATDKHPVWYSDVSMDGTGPTLLTSSPITLDPGNKLYLVQIKTQLGFQATLSQSRLHLTTY